MADEAARAGAPVRSPAYTGGWVIPLREGPSRTLERGRSYACLTFSIILFAAAVPVLKLTSRLDLWSPSPAKKI